MALLLQQEVQQPPDDVAYGQGEGGTKEGGTCVFVDAVGGRGWAVQGWGLPHFSMSPTQPQRGHVLLRFQLGCLFTIC